MLRRMRVAAMLAVVSIIVLSSPSAYRAFATSTSAEAAITLGSSITVYVSQAIGVIFDSGTNWACIAAWMAYFAAYATAFACATIIGCIIATLTVAAAWANIEASCN